MTITHRHRQNLLNKAQRAMPIIDEWADNLTRADAGLTRADALAEIRGGLDGSCGKAAAARLWWMLGREHAARNPHHTHRGDFHTSKTYVLANIDTRIAAAKAQERVDAKRADPFAHLIF